MKLVYNGKNVIIDNKPKEARVIGRRGNKMKKVSDLLTNDIVRIWFHSEAMIKTIKGLDLTKVPNLKKLDLYFNPIEDFDELDFNLIPKLESLSFNYDSKTFKKFRSFPYSLKELTILSHEPIQEVKQFILQFFTFNPLKLSVLYPTNYLDDYEFLLMSNVKEIQYSFTVKSKFISPFILQKRETIRKRIWLIHNLFYFKRK